MAKTWDEVVLSTTASIARFENEINANAGTKQVSGLLFNGTTKLSFVASQATSVLIYYSNGTTATITPTVYVVTPADDAEIIKIKILAGATAYVGSILYLTEGRGLDLFDQYYQICATTDATWSFFEIARSWNDKIDIAKETIGNRIKVYMINRGQNEVLVQNSGYELLDAIHNPLVFCQSSDALVAQLAYEDMLGIGSNEGYKDKIALYTNKYEKAFEIAMNLFQNDPCFSGEPVDNARIQGQLIY